CTRVVDEQTSHVVVAEARGIVGVMAIEFQAAGTRIVAPQSVPRAGKPNVPFVVLCDSGNGPEDRLARNLFGDKAGDLPPVSVDPITSTRASDPKNSSPVLNYRVHAADAQAFGVTGFLAVSLE